MTPPGDLPHPALTLHHAAGACPVYVGAGCLGQLPALVERHLPSRRLAVIADDNVAEAIPSPLEATVLTVAAGESSKTREEWARLTDLLIALGYGRDSGIIALGGGVTGDLAGFVAATYLRGVPVLQVPTSLLAMVDASLGGKTGVDTAMGKNLVGAFHQPVAVVIDPLVLRTLPEARYRGGMAEVVKHAVIADAGHFEWLATNAGAILARDPDVLDILLRQSVGIKAAIVEEDEREAGRRAVLNAGHTIGHALEAASGFALDHGEAVARGLVAEARLGERMGVTADGTAARVAGLLELFDLPTTLPDDIDLDRAWAALRHDKKAIGGELRIVLLSEVGVVGSPEQGRWTFAVPEEAVRELLGGSHVSGATQPRLST